MTAQRPETVFICDVSALAPDAGSVDALARLELLARRQGTQLQLREVSPELQQLLGLCGLAGVLRVEAVGQPEEREERAGVEEERQLGDPPA
jgi:hypothetical protein